jgi:hypothetical protein
MAVEARSEDYGMLQHVIDTLFLNRKRVPRLDLILEAEAADLNPELMEIVTLLPAGTYTRHRMCMQLNSALTGHGWGMKYGTVE